ncbi:hypothetical protein CMO88_03180 [Candidatus Woesearchaeota archaeon]|mgnify:CR=1 FL=1|nr:hypothetical protein [Candidatus Woesearchaeota archaeon]|tara:strand:- start:304 stop:681 length:378 start_codon:yes stop_codon:yes gene_type:complete
MSVFVDANVIIKAFIDNEDKDKCRSLLYDEFTTDTLCLVEAHEAISRINKNQEHASNCIKSLFKLNSSIVQLDQNLLYMSFKAPIKKSLNTFDLIHYVAAIINNCSEFVSYDKDFNNLEIKRIEP